MHKENSFIYIWRGWTVSITFIFISVFILFFIFVPEQRSEMWPSIFMIPVIAMLQSVIIAAGVIIGNKLWFILKQYGKS